MKLEGLRKRKSGFNRKNKQINNKNSQHLMTIEKVNKIMKRIKMIWKAWKKKLHSSRIKDFMEKYDISLNQIENII